MAALGASVPPPEVQWNGTAWKIGHPTQGAKALLERLVLQTAEANLDAAKGVLSDKRYAAEEKRFGDALMGRTWATFGELWLATMNGPSAFPLFFTGSAIAPGVYGGTGAADVAGSQFRVPHGARAGAPRFFRGTVRGDARGRRAETGVRGAVRNGDHGGAALDAYRLSLHTSLAVMGGEPWCFPPDVIARLTDYQILHVYVYPLVDRNKRMERERNGHADSSAAPPIPAESLEELVSVYRGMGLNDATARAAAEDDWNRRR
jgi:hypothetical protein